VRLDVLRRSATTSGCAYKGFAEYWTLPTPDRRFDDVAWSYRTPLPECQKIAGLVCFYNERVDLTVDGVAQPRPRTHFS